LAASGQIELDASGVALVGELALSGAIRSVPSVLPAVEMARAEGVGTVVVPAGNSDEIPTIEGIEVIALEHLVQVQLSSGQ
jgi:magnesium chelatase family protein